MAVSVIPTNGLIPVSQRFTIRTKLFDGNLTTSDATYNLSQNTSGFIFICVETSWYDSGVSDNVAVFPTGSWVTNEYFDMHRHNDQSKPYLRISNRNANTFIAKVTDVGIHLKIFGLM